MVTASFEQNDTILFVAEDMPSLEVCIILSHTKLQRQVIVTVATEAGTAKGIIVDYIGTTIIIIARSKIFFI